MAVKGSDSLKVNFKLLRKIKDSQKLYEKDNYWPDQG